MYLHGKSVTLPTPAAPLRLQQDEKLGAITRTPRHGQCFLHRRAKSGSVVHIATPDSSALKFAQVRFQLAIHYPEAETVHLVRMTQISMHSNLLKRLLNPEVASQSSACLVIELIVLCVHPGDIKYLDATRSEERRVGKECSCRG